MTRSTFSVDDEQLLVAPMDKIIMDIALQLSKRKYDMEQQFVGMNVTGKDNFRGVITGVDRGNVSVSYNGEKKTMPFTKTRMQRCMAQQQQQQQQQPQRKV